VKHAPRAAITSDIGAVCAPVQADGDVAKQARNANIEPAGFDANNPAPTGEGHMRTAGSRTNDWLRRPGDAVHRLFYRQFDHENIDRSIVNETPYHPPGGRRPSGIAP
jgi:hypothetical protein